ncbi:MAG: cobalamin-dependent protein [Actinobacteria bacterium]|nr:cobalamin-dependent protein [Actinomycetota bacterium]
MAEDLVSKLVELKEEEALQIVRKRLDEGEDPMKILDDAREALVIVGQRYSDGEYFIPDMLYAGEIVEALTRMVKPKLAEGAGGEAEKLGKVIIGTVAGDIHDIGKNIVVFMLDVNGFEVIDLGVDVPTQAFVDKISETGAPVVGLSGFLTLSFDSMKDTVQAIVEAGLRDKVKIMVGGGVLNDSVSEYVGADSFGRFAGDAVALAKKWTGGE